MSHYTWHNVTESSRITTKYEISTSPPVAKIYSVQNTLYLQMLVLCIFYDRHAFATLSFLAETFIFLYVGMDALDIDKWRSVSDSPGTSVAVSSILMGLVMLGRAAFVFPLSFLSNLAKKNQSEKINFKMQV